MSTESANPERLLLLRFVCAFAWVDGEVQDSERKFVRRLMSKMPLADDEVKEVESWLLIQPDPVDPAQVPAEHRKMFLEAVRAMIFIDGNVGEAEQAAFDALRKGLLA